MHSYQTIDTRLHRTQFNMIIAYTYKKRASKAKGLVSSGTFTVHDHNKDPRVIIKS